MTCLLVLLCCSQLVKSFRQHMKISESQSDRLSSDHLTLQELSTSGTCRSKQTLHSLQLCFACGLTASYTHIHTHIAPNHTVWHVSAEMNCLAHRGSAGAVTNHTVACEASLVYALCCDTGPLCETWVETSMCHLLDVDLFWVQQVTLYSYENSAVAA